MAQSQLRYARQVMMPDWGEERQRKLADSRILVVGAGGLGSPLLFYLAAAGVGSIAIADFDVVEESNLNRQILHSTEDLGRLKVASAAQTLQAMNPEVAIDPLNLRVTAENMNALAWGYDLVLDAVDSFGAKLLINDACVKAGKPFVHGGATGWNGQLYFYQPGNACLRCFFPSLPVELEAPQGLGILGATAGCIGTQQAIIAIKYLTGMPMDAQRGMLVVFDGRSLRQRSVRVSKSDACTACGTSL